MGTDKRIRQKANRELARKARIRREKMGKARRRGLIFGIGIPLIVAALFGVSQLQDGPSTSSDTSFDVVITNPPQTLETLPGEKITGDTPCPKADGTQKRTTVFEKAPKLCIDPAKTYTATFDTSEGKIEVSLNTKTTPNTVNNFVVLSRYKFYDTSYIFRTDTTLDIIQGGGATNTDGPNYTIKDEGTGFKYSEGDLVMARSPGPDSGGSQFFFVTGPKASVLDSQGTYVTFGKITKGLEIAQAIIGLSSGSGELGGAPAVPVKINSVTINEK